VRPVKQPYFSEFNLENKTLVIETDESKMRISFSDAKDMAERIIELLEKHTK